MSATTPHSISPPPQRQQNPEVTVFLLPVVFRDPETGADLFEYDSVDGRPIIRAKDSGGRLWFDVKPRGFVDGVMQPGSRENGTADAVDCTIYQPSTGHPAVSLTTEMESLGAGGTFTIYRGSGNQAAYIDGVRSGGHLVLLCGEEAGQNPVPGQEPVAFELHSEEAGAVLLINPAHQHGTGIKIGFHQE